MARGLDHGGYLIPHASEMTLSSLLNRHTWRREGHFNHLPHLTGRGHFALVGDDLPCESEYVGRRMDCVAGCEDLASGAMSLISDIAANVLSPLLSSNYLYPAVMKGLLDTKEDDKSTFGPARHQARWIKTMALLASVISVLFFCLNRPLSRTGSVSVKLSRGVPADRPSIRRIRRVPFTGNNAPTILTTSAAISPSRSTTPTRPILGPWISLRHCTRLTLDIRLSGHW